MVEGQRARAEVNIVPPYGGQLQRLGSFDVREEDINEMTTQAAYPLLERLLVEKGLQLKMYTNKDASYPEIWSSACALVPAGIGGA
jgi:hypothetical protein